MINKKTTYIYCNEYLTKAGTRYFYVGSHTWQGKPGELDAGYHGSSHVVSHFDWKPCRERILEVVEPERALVAEREWIENYCRRYGIADVALQLAKTTGWTSKFPTHGKMLNLHANSARQMHTPEVKEKIKQSYSHEKRQRATAKRLLTTDMSDAAAKAAKAALERSKWVNEKVSWKGLTGTCEEVWKMSGLSKSTFMSAVCRLRKYGCVVVGGSELSFPGRRVNLLRRCQLNDGFVGTSKEIEMHTGLPHGTVTSAMTKAYREGKALVKKQWLFKVYVEV